VRLYDILIEIHALTYLTVHVLPQNFDKNLHRVIIVYDFHLLLVGTVTSVAILLSATISEQTECPLGGVGCPAWYFLEITVVQRIASIEREIKH
jgi:hypothetical protein